MASLHRLLWGDGGGEHLDEWLIRPWETPAIGLPVRVATGLYHLAREAERPGAWNASMGPSVWSIRDSDNGALTDGRRGQLGHNCGPTAGGEVVENGRDIEVQQVEEWEVPAHAAFFAPFWAGDPDVCDESYALYCDTLLLVTALDGGRMYSTALSTEVEGYYRMRIGGPGEHACTSPRRRGHVSNPLSAGRSTRMIAVKETAESCWRRSGSAWRFRLQKMNSDRNELTYRSALMIKKLSERSDCSRQTMCPLRSSWRCHSCRLAASCTFA